MKKIILMALAVFGLTTSIVMAQVNCTQLHAKLGRGEITQVEYDKNGCK